MFLWQKKKKDMQNHVGLHKKTIFGISWTISKRERRLLPILKFIDTYQKGTEKKTVSLHIAWMLFLLNFRFLRDQKRKNHSSYFWIYCIFQITSASCELFLVKHLDMNNAFRGREPIATTTITTTKIQNEWDLINGTENWIREPLKLLFYQSKCFFFFSYFVIHNSIVTFRFGFKLKVRLTNLNQVYVNWNQLYIVYRTTQHTAAHQEHRITVFKLPNTKFRHSSAHWKANGKKFE